MSFLTKLVQYSGENVTSVNETLISFFGKDSFVVVNVEVRIVFFEMTVVKEVCRKVKSRVSVYFFFGLAVLGGAY